MVACWVVLKLQVRQLPAPRVWREALTRVYEQWDFKEKGQEPGILECQDNDRATIA